MKLIGVIPSRYGSTRFPGKPLAQICGKPMIYWVYNSAKQVKNLETIYVATDDERIYNTCRELGLNVIMTANTHMNCFHRLHEVAHKIPADRYIMINGDEPLIEPQCIQTVVDKIIETKANYLFSYRKLTNAVEAMDSGNIKVVISNEKLLYLSRTPIPYPQKSVTFDYKKIIGIQGLSTDMLDFFVNTPPGEIEQIEDIAELRFIENGKTVDCVEVFSDSISVDNPKDIEKVTLIMEQRQQNTQKENIK